MNPYSWDFDPIHGAPQIPGVSELRPLGHGAMGDVYRGRDAEGRDVAVKVCVRSTPEALKRFAREAELLARFRAPEVVRVYAWGTEPGFGYLICELIDGTTLDHAARGRPLGERLALVLELVRAVAVLHAAGVVHRDLKPSNVLIDATGRLRLIDFGVSIGLDQERLTQTGRGVGTPQYMAPEQFDGAPPAPTSDVWSLGVLAYELLSERPAFTGATVHELMSNLLESPAPLGGDVPPAVEAAVLGALRVEPGKRYPDAQAMADALQTASATKGPSDPGRAAAALAVAVAALGCAGVFGAWAATRGSDPAAAGRAPVEPVDAPVEPVDEDRKPRALADSYVNAGFLKHDEGDYTDAIADYDRAIELAPDLARAWAKRGLAKARLGDYPGARVDYDEALRLDPEDPAVLVNRGVALLHLGHLDDAMADHDLAIAVDPTRSRSFLSRAGIKTQQGRFEEALLDYDRALELDPESVEAWSDRGLAKASLGRLQEALVDFDAALARDPQHARSLRERGVVKGRLGQSEVAIADLTRALVLDPTHAKAWTTRGILQAKLGRRDKGLEDLNRALQIDPDDSHALGERGAMLNAMRHLEPALRDLNRSLELAPRSRWAPRAYTERGLAKSRLGRLKEAIARS